MKIKKYKFGRRRKTRIHNKTPINRFRRRRRRRKNLTFFYYYYSTVWPANAFLKIRRRRRRRILSLLCRPPRSAPNDLQHSVVVTHLQRTESPSCRRFDRGPQCRSDRRSAVPRPWSFARRTAVKKKLYNLALYIYIYK